MRHYSTPFLPKRGIPRLTPAQRDFILNYDDEEETPGPGGRQRKSTTMVAKYTCVNGKRTWEYVPGEPLHGIEYVSARQAKKIRAQHAQGTPLAELVSLYDLRPEWLEEILTTTKPIYKFGSVE